MEESLSQTPLHSQSDLIPFRDNAVRPFGIKRSKNIYVFVYGSLRKGMINHYRLEEFNAKFLGYYQTNKKYYMILML
jgi:hypothetical protein